MFWQRHFEHAEVETSGNTRGVDFRTERPCATVTRGEWTVGGRFGHDRQGAVVQVELDVFLAQTGQIDAKHMGFFGLFHEFTGMTVGRWRREGAECLIEQAAEGRSQ